MKQYLAAWALTVAATSAAYLPIGKPPIWVIDAAFYGAMALFMHWGLRK